MKFDWLAPILVLFLVFVLLSAVIVSCARIEEEDKETDATETVVVTDETKPREVDLEAVINERLDQLTADLEALQSEIPEHFTEHNIIAAHPEVFASLTDLGADAVPYLLEIGGSYWSSYQNYRLDGGLAYARCILAYAAAQKIAPSTFDRTYPSPDGGYYLHLQTETLWGMADSYWGIVYDAVLYKADGTELVRTEGCSSLAYVDWTADGRYVVVSDRLKNEAQLSMTVAFDTARGEAVDVVGRTILDAAAREYGMQYRNFSTRYQGYTDDGYLRIWFGLRMADDRLIAGYYDYDAMTGAVMATEHALFDAASDGADIARGMEFHEIGSTITYLMTDYFIYRLEVEVKDGWERTLYINEVPALQGFLFLNEFRVIDSGHLAVVTGGTDVNSEHLYIFDRGGRKCFDTYYLTDKGMVYQGIKAVEDDRILLLGSRGYHGPTLVSPTKEQITAGDYADLLYNDPISDTISGEALTVYEYGEVPLYPDRASVDSDLNPALAFAGVYALPILGDEQFGQIELVEITQTLGELLDGMYNTEA